MRNRIKVKLVFVKSDRHYDFSYFKRGDEILYEKGEYMLPFCNSEGWEIVSPILVADEPLIETCYVIEDGVELPTVFEWKNNIN